MANQRVKSANQLVHDQLDAYLKGIEGKANADCLAYFGPIIPPIDDAIRDAVEAKKEKRDKLLFLLETDGGFVEITRRISDTLRYHYPVVDFIVPGHAMSAGTILAMSGDAIWMDYYSVLGPIDPQIPREDGMMLPALGYLRRYEALLDKGNAGQLSTAEMAVLLAFDQGELYAFQQARDLSKSLLQEWLAKYKFKDWKKTQTRKIPVTDEMRKERATEVADALNDVTRWNSHGLGISMEVLRRDLNLTIDDFGAKPELNELVRKYHKLMVDFMVKMSNPAVVHACETFENFAG